MISKASRTEQRAYDVLTRVLGHQVTHVDGDGAQKHHDAEIHYSEDRIAAIEVTAPPAHRELKKAAIAESKGQRHVFRGTQPVDFDLAHLRDWLEQEIHQPWCQENIDKLRRSGRDELHLVLHLHGSDGLGKQLSILDAENPPDKPISIAPLTDLWLLGAAGTVLRYSATAGWSRELVPVTDDDKRAYTALST